MTPKRAFRWTGDPEPGDLPFFEVLADLGLDTAPDGRSVQLTRAGVGLAVEIGSGRYRIRYQDRTHLFRALGHLAAHWNEPGWTIEETCAFRTLGAMADASRNAVPTPATLKTFLRAMAVMGFNQLMLYMEDTFEIPEQPYFGYMRGRYTKAELKDIDDYAFALGIEVVPCIQTLAHLPRFLHWKATIPLRDTVEILLPGSDDTYRFLDNLLRAVTAPFRSRKVHLGMDEAFEVGLGKYLTLHGLRNRFDLINEHLAQVVAIGRKYSIEPLMWSDMYFRLADPSGDFAADQIPAGVAEAIHPAVQLVYWDYFTTDKAFYRRKLAQHHEMKPGTMFAGGIWTFNGMAVAYQKTIITTLPALEACKEAGVQDVMAALWGDDGSETHVFQALYGLQLYAEIAYGQGGADPEAFDFDRVNRRFRECTGADPEAFLALDRIDNVKGQTANLRGFNTSKLAFYQDPLMGIFDRHWEGLNLDSHFAALAPRFESWSKDSHRWAYIFEPIARYCRILALKAELGRHLKDAYDRKDREQLIRLADRAREAAGLVRGYHRSVRVVYDQDFKPFGGEVTDIRLGGLAARLDQTASRIRDYTDGRIPALPELEVDRLWHDGRNEPGDQQEVRFNRWHQIVTTGYISHNVP